MWDTVKSLIGSGAPLIGTMIGGPAGALVGKMVGDLLGVDGDDASAVEAELRGNPDALLKLKQYEIAHKEKLEAMKLDELGLRIGDIQNARGRQTEHEKITGKSDINLYVLAWTIVIGFFGLIGILMFVTLPPGSNEVVFMLLGTLSAGFGAVMQYFFGSSKSSADKTQHMNKLAMKIGDSK